MNRLDPCAERNCNLFIFTIVIVHDVRKAQSWSAGGRGTTLGTIIFYLIYLAGISHNIATVLGRGRAISGTSNGTDSAPPAAPA